MSPSVQIMIKELVSRAVDSWTIKTLLSWRFPYFKRQFFLTKFNFMAILNKIQFSVELRTSHKALISFHTKLKIKIGSSTNHNKKLLYCTHMIPFLEAMIFFSGSLMQYTLYDIFDWFFSNFLASMFGPQGMIFSSK